MFDKLFAPMYSQRTGETSSLTPSVIDAATMMYPPTSSKSKFESIYSKNTSQFNSFFCGRWGTNENLTNENFVAVLFKSKILKKQQLVLAIQDFEFLKC